MRYRKLDENDDYTMGTGADFFVNTPDAVAQAILTRLRLWRGEWFLDNKDGTPWLTEILGKRQLANSPDAAIKQRILGTQGVKEILSYSSTFDGNTRRLSINTTVGTIYGQTTINEVL